MHPTPLSHSGDPETSTTAALQLDAQGRLSLKEAIITLLDERPRTGDELIGAYTARAEVNGWPLIADLHSVKRRLSELHTIHHVVKESGDTRPSNHGKAATVWALSTPAEEARIIVRMRGAA